MNLSWGCPPSEDYLKLLVKESSYEPLDEEGYGKIVVDADGVWVHYPDGSKTLLSADTFLKLEDTPGSYNGAGGKVVAVKSDESGLEFAEVEATDEKVKADSGDATSGYLADKVDNNTIEVDTTNHCLKVKDGVFAEASHTHDWGEVDKTGSKLEDISDVPAYSGNAGKVLAVKSDESGTEWVEGGSGADPNAVHVNEAGEINGVAIKSTPVDTDVVLIEDSEDNWNKKKIELSNLLGGGAAAGAGYVLNVVRTTAFDLGATKTWYSIPFDTVLKNNGFEKVSDTQYKVLHTGTYELKYRVHIKQVSVEHHISAILTRNGNEIDGSWSQDSVATTQSSETHGVEGSVIADLEENDIIELKVATNQDVTNEINIHPSSYLPTPNTWVYASLIIEGVGGGGAEDPNAIHVNQADEINTLLEKSTLVNDDIIVIEDSEDNWSKKKARLSNLLSGGSSYINAIRTTNKSIATGAWTPLEFDTIVASNGISMPSTIEFSFSNSGVFQISYGVHVRRQGGGHHFVSRLLKNDVEVLGSFAQQSTVSSDGNEVHPTVNVVIVPVQAGDIIKVEIGLNEDQNPVVDLFDDANLPDPDTKVYAFFTAIQVA